MVNQISSMFRSSVTCQIIQPEIKHSAIISSDDSDAII